MSDPEKELPVHQTRDEEVFYGNWKTGNKMKMLNRKLVEELSSVRKGFENLSELVQQQSHQLVRSEAAFEPAGNANTTACERFDVTDGVTDQKIDVASFQPDALTNHSLQADSHRTIATYEQKLREKDEEIRGLEDLLQQVNKKLETRLVEQMEQMKKMASSVEQLTQLVSGQRLNEASLQMKTVLAVVESMQTTINSWTGMMNHFKHLSTEKSTEMETEMPVYLVRLKRIYRQLAEKLSAKAVAAELFQRDVLSLAELQEVLCSKTPITAAENLLDRILNTRCKDSYDCFLRALIATGQEHIFLWLTYDGCNIASEHTEIIRQKYTFLLDHLRPKDSGLVALLFQEEMIDQREREYLDSGEGSVCQAERLLSVLCLKSLQQFEQFLIALDRTGQGHIADEMRGFRTFVDNSATLKCSLHIDRSSKTSTATGTVTHVIAASPDRDGAVAGLTIHHDELFIARSEPKGHIEVYNATNFTFRRNIEVAELNNSHCFVEGLASCDSNNCLYISYYVTDYGFGHVVRVEPIDADNVVDWKVKGKPSGLSVNSEHNLLVACWGLKLSHKLIEYTTRGQLVREIRLQDDVVDTRHAIQLDKKPVQYLVCHGVVASLHRVCVVDANGRVQHCFGNSAGSETGQLNGPQHLAVDRQGLIFVAEEKNGRISVMDSTLKWSRDLKLESGGVIGPRVLYLDERRNYLFVGEWNDSDSRVVIIKL